MYTIYVKFDCLDGKREQFVERMKAEGIVDAIRAGGRQDDNPCRQ